MSPNDVSSHGPSITVFGYLDTNGVEDFSVPRAPIDRDMRSALLTSIAERRIIVPFSEAVAHEIAAITLTDREKASRLGRFYLKIASFDHGLPASGPALRNAVAERLGDPVLSSYANLTRRERRSSELRLAGRAPSDLADIVAKYKRDSENWATEYRGYRDDARKAILAKRSELTPRPLPEAVAAIWPGLASQWAWALVEKTGLSGRVRQAKLTDDDLLSIRSVRAAVGCAVALAAAHTINARLPRPSEFGDAQHFILAAYAGIPLVTADENLRKLIESIPDSPLRVISPVEFLEEGGLTGRYGLSE